MNDAFRWLYLRLTEMLYGDWAGFYDLVSAIVSGGNWDRWRLRALDYADGEAVLELGPGTGHLLAEIVNSGRLGVGVEASPNMAARAANRLRSQGAQPAVVQAQAQALPFLSESFDSVVSTFPAGYILDPATMLESMRVLRTSRGNSSGGRFVISGIWADTSYSILRLIFAPFYGRPNMRPISGLVSSLQEAGFDPAIMEDVTGSFRVGTVVATKRSD